MLSMVKHKLGHASSVLYAKDTHKAGEPTSEGGSDDVKSFSGDIVSSRSISEIEIDRAL